jgi:hypothetical protein
MPNLRILVAVAAALGALAASAQPARLWTRTTALTAAANNLARGIRADRAGNSILFRIRKARGVGDPLGHAEVVKLNSSGAVLWTRPLVGDGLGACLPAAMAVDAANDVVVSVVSPSSFVAPRLYLYKLNGATGAVRWTKTEPDFGLFFAPTLDTDSSGNVFLGGTGFDGTDARMRVVKLASATGAQLWSSTLARTAAGVTDIVTDLDVDATNNVAVVGYSTATDGCSTKPQVLVIGRLRGTDGARLWTTTYLPATNDEASLPLVETDTAGNVYAAATFRRGTTTTLWGLTKRTAATGAASFSRLVNPASTFLSFLSDLTIDAGGVCMGGESFGVGGSGFLIQRYTTTGAAPWSRTLTNRSSSGEFFFTALTRRMRPSATSAVYCALVDDSTNQTRVVRVNTVTGALTWDRLATGSNDSGPVELDVLSTGDPVVYRGSRSGTGVTTVENSHWHRLLASNGNVAISANGTNSVVPSMDFGSQVLVDTAGNAFAGGGSAGRLVVQKVSSTGALLWQRVLESTASSNQSSLEEGVLAMARDASGNVYAVGENRGGDAVFKLNGATGATLYSVFGLGFGGENVAVNSANELYLPGSPPSGVRKLNAAGGTAWTRTIPGSLMIDSVSHVALSSTGTPFVVGETLSPQGCGEPNLEKVVVARLNPATGAIVWVKELAPPVDGQAEARGIAVDPAGNVIVAGTFASTAGGADYFAARLNGTTGATLWSKRFDRATRFQSATAMVLDGQGNVAITGVSVETTGPATFTVKAANATGNQLWANVSSSPAGNRRPDSLSRDAAGNFYVTGTIGDAASTRQFGQKLNGATGAQVWQVLCTGGLEAYGSGARGAVGPGNNLHLVGTSTSTGVGLGQMTLVKFAP